VYKLDRTAAANEMPEGTQIICGDFSEGGTYYSCSYQPDVVYAEYGGHLSLMTSLTPMKIKSAVK
jgi:hypothetical protein